MIAGYLLLLGFSTFYRVTQRTIVAPESSVAVQVSDQTIEVAFREWETSDPADHRRPVVVLLHGSPGRSDDFRALAPKLSREYRVLAPDLPGFGASTRKIEDYSVRSHAVIVEHWLRELAVDQAHIVGFSMGGGVALELIDLAPERVLSLTLLSAIGVQELELLGDYHLNHAVHGLQLAGLWILREGTPHFGLFDGGMLSVEYARNFYDTDQRPLRSILLSLDLPTLVIHGRADPLVPVAAALEHHRLVPQSELLLFDASHFMVFRPSIDLVEGLSGFLGRVDSDRVSPKDSISDERRLASQEPFDPSRVPPFRGFALGVMMLLLAGATLVSEDLTCIGAGLLVSQGQMAFLPATFACALGILIGDLALYGAGRFLGRGGLHRRPWRWLLSSSQVEASALWFQQKGPMVILTSRFLPGARLPTYFAAGLLRAGFWRFLGWFVLAVALWTPILVGLSSIVGTTMFDYFETFRRYALLGIVLVALLVLVAARGIPLLSTHSGRRLLLGRWWRWRRWEFWPRYLFYPPVILWVLWLGIRYRKLTLFTVANPGISEGGFVGESKAEILEGLSAEFVATFRRIPGSSEFEGDRRSLVARFCEEHGLDFPIVLKPDVGQRGEGVCLADSVETVDDFLASHADPCIVQEYVPGVEVGAFYIRHPTADQGSIFSVTDKRMPAVTGDGVKTLETLILEDDRAVCLAPLYLSRFVDARTRVVPAGESVRLAELGTHCLGAVFLDGQHLATQEFSLAVETMAKSMAGFYFGRFDLRAPSYSHFERGEGIRVIELNGVTSEATHIYDPKNTLFGAYRVLFRQWELAFECGAACRDQGHEPVGLRRLLALVLAYSRPRVG